MRTDTVPQQMADRTLLPEGSGRWSERMVLGGRMHNTQSDRPGGQVAQDAPRNCRSKAHNRAVGSLLHCAVVLGTLLASVVSAQYLEATIKLPDTLGPLTGPYHLAWDENPAHPRLYVGGEGDSGGVIVAEPITCKRLARISTGPVKSLCYVPPHRKLYVASLSADSIAVVDCATNQISSVIRTSDSVPVIQYNAQNDRLYCGGDEIAVIDCATDSMVGAIPVAASSFGYDSASNKLYVGRNGPLGVIDCTSDSLVATIPEVSSATALCFNPTAQKIYAVTTDTLFAIRDDGDSVVARLPFDSLRPLLACDPQRNRVYCAGSDSDWGILSSVDCSADTVLWVSITEVPPTFLACNTDRDALYAFLRGGVDKALVYDGASGHDLARVPVDGVPSGGGWSQVLDRLYCAPLVYPEPVYSCCLLSAVDGTRDSIVGVVPLTVRAEAIALDTLRNRLYFTYGSTACGSIGVVDCDQNVVTSYSYAGRYPTAPVYNPNNNRLYYTTWDGVKVYDCSTNAVRGRVANATGYTYAIRLHVGPNKLYAHASDTLGNYVIDVINCDTDSVIKVVDTPYDYGSFKELLLVPEDNTLWCLGVWLVVVIDCLGDSIAYAAPDTLGSINDAVACPEDRRIYTGGQGDITRVVNMDGPADVDTLHERIPGSYLMRFLSIPGAHKAYWVANNSASSAHLFVIDTRTSTLVDSLWLNRTIAGMYLDHTGNYVYCAAMYDTMMLVMDARVDSVVARIGLPPIEVAMKNPLVLNRATNRIYVAQTDVYTSGNDIPVIRDRVLDGLEELTHAESWSRGGPTVVRRGTPLRVLAESELWDVAGRRAAVLRVGPNDVCRLAPGVYFVCEKPDGAGRRSQTAKRIVIAE
jgi:DNA-binding beta-propeller fold protein YncE